jgi:hypothetical protein
MVIGDVNNYMAVNQKGKVKCKGRFEWEDLEKKKVAMFHKNKSFLIIPKAIHAYFIHGIKPEDFLAQNKNIFDYCGAVKAKGGWHFETRKIIHGIPEKYTKMTLEQKREFLKVNGWEQSWDDDNWVREDALNKEANTGISTDSAFCNVVKKESIVEKTKLQKIVRYFISKTGDKIVKTHADGRDIQIEAGLWQQTVVNRLDVDRSFDTYDINDAYYLESIYKEINQIEKVKNRNTVQMSLF